MRKIFNRNFDLEGNELSRVATTYAKSKILPMGSFGSGPGPRCIVTLAILHYFSRPAYWLLVRREDQLRRVYHKIKRLVKR